MYFWPSFGHLVRKARMLRGFIFLHLPSMKDQSRNREALLVFHSHYSKNSTSSFLPDLIGDKSIRSPWNFAQEKLCREEDDSMSRDIYSFLVGDESLCARLGPV